MSRGLFVSSGLADLVVHSTCHVCADSLAAGLAQLLSNNCGSNIYVISQRRKRQLGRVHIDIQSLLAAAFQIKPYQICPSEKTLLAQPKSAQVDANIYGPPQTSLLTVLRQESLGGIVRYPQRCHELPQRRGPVLLRAFQTATLEI